MSSLIKEHFNKDISHHAYLIEGIESEVWPELKLSLEEIGVKTEANPDLFLFLTDTFKIDDARNIKSLSSDKSFGGDNTKKENKKIFVISANNFLQEAQNILLKIFEEPNKNTHLFIITPDSNLLLKTLLSRLYIVKYPKNLSFSKETEEFIKMNVRERIDFIKENFVSKEEEEEGVSIRTKATQFLNSLEKTLHNKIFIKNSKNLENISFFEQILIAREYLRQSGSSPKSLLEGVALSVPEF